MLIFTSDSHVTLHRLRTSSPDTGGYITHVRWDTDAGLIFDARASRFVSSITSGASVGDAARSADLGLNEAKKLCEEMYNSGFIASIDHTTVEDTSTPISPWFPKVPAKYFLWLLSPWIIIPCFLIMLAGISIGVLHLDYFPRVTDFFWHSNPFISIITIFIINSILIFIHELAHFVTTRAVGGQAKMMLDHQMTTVVVATEQYHLAVQTPAERSITYLAGLFVDVLSIAIIFITYYLSDLYTIPLDAIQPFLNIALLLQLNAIVWEFGTFLTTDVYYYLNEITQEYDLKVNTKKFVSRHLAYIHHPLIRKITAFLRKNIFSRKSLSDALDFRSITALNKRNYILYLLGSLMGFTATSMMFFFINIPKYILFTVYAFQLLLSSISNGNALLPAISAVLTLILINENFLTLLYLTYKGRHDK